MAKPRVEEGGGDGGWGERLEVGEADAALAVQIEQLVGPVDLLCAVPGSLGGGRGHSDLKQLHLLPNFKFMALNVLVSQMSGILCCKKKNFFIKCFLFFCSSVLNHCILSYIYPHMNVFCGVKIYLLINMLRINVSFSSA